MGCGHGLWCFQCDGVPEHLMTKAEMHEIASSWKQQPWVTENMALKREIAELKQTIRDLQVAVLKARRVEE